MHKRCKQAARAALAAALTLITILSLVPVRGHLAIDVWDKAQHAGAYVLLAILAWASGTTRNLSVKAALYLSAYGVGIEVAQGFLPWRSFSILDMLANATGIAIAASMVEAGRKLSERIHQSL